MKSDNNRPAITGRTRDAVIFLQKSILFLAQHWFVLATLLASMVLGAGFLAPALMSAEQPEAGRAVYRFLAPHNHQLPQRSYFLFGQSDGIQTYSTEQLIAWGADPRNMEAFLGNPDIGFKMALNHRMTAIFIAILLGGLGWGLGRGRPRLSFVWLLLMAMPLLLDGFSHMISERSGEGFRAGNAWAIRLTGGIFPAEFYTGNTFGSLNWGLRTLTGLIFGLGLVWFLFTYLDNRFLAVRAQLEPKLRRIGAIK